jgi:hypothetical protein
MANKTPEATTPSSADPYVKGTQSSASDPHPMPPRQISEKELADKALAAERPEQAASKHAGETGNPLATSNGEINPQKQEKLSASEQDHRDKVEREREIMRDPHEKGGKDHLPADRPMPHYGHGSDSVSALRIKTIQPSDKDPNKSVLTFFEAYDPVTVTAPWITANLPAAGGWYVVDAKGPRFLNAVDFQNRYQRTAVA